jgi:hypothetical protein
MKTPTLFFFILVISIIGLSSCHRPEKTYYETGELKEEIFKDKEGKKHGQYLRYHLEGGVAEEAVLSTVSPMGCASCLCHRSDGIRKSVCQRPTQRLSPGVLSIRKVDD